MELDELAAAPELQARVEDTLVVLVDRLAAGPDARARLADSVETAFAEGAGSAVVHVVGGPRLRFSERFECARCSRPFEQPQPRLFSFNNPHGACATCHGFGNLIEIDQDLVVPHKTRSLADGAIEPWNKPHYKGLLDELRRFAKRHAIPMDTPWAELDEQQRRLVLEGDEEFQGVVGFFRWLEGKKYKVQVRVFLSRYRGYQTCPACGGRRLRAGGALGQGRRACRSTSCAPCRCATRAGSWRPCAPPEERAVARGVLHELERRLRVLADVGLDYLTLDRAFGSLSGGEAQRIALAAALGTGLVGTLYVLDEPSIGLHPRRHRPSDRHPEGAARPGQHRSGRRARPRRSWPSRIASSTWARARASRAAGWCSRAATPSCWRTGAA